MKKNNGDDNLSIEEFLGVTMEAFSYLRESVEWIEVLKSIYQSIREE